MIEKIRQYCNKTKKPSCNLAKMQDPRGLNDLYNHQSFLSVDDKNEEHDKI